MSVSNGHIESLASRASGCTRASREQLERGRRRMITGRSLSSPHEPPSAAQAPRRASKVEQVASASVSAAAISRCLSRGCQSLLRSCTDRLADALAGTGTRSAPGNRIATLQLHDLQAWMGTASLAGRQSHAHLQLLWTNNCAIVGPYAWVVEFIASDFHRWRRFATISGPQELTEGPS